MKKWLLLTGISIILVVVAMWGMWTWLHLRAPPPRTLVPNPTLSLVVEPQDGILPILSLVRNATISIDLVMYELTDTQVEQELVAAKQRGVAVRVLLNEGYYGASSTANKAAYDFLQNNGLQVRWTPASFSLTHEKLLITDDTHALIMGFNLTPQYYPTSRDFAVNDSDETDVEALVKVFNADWNNTSIATPEAKDLLWSPNSRQEILSLISHAKHSILIYNEEMSDREVIKALQDAAGRGVSVNIIMTYQSTWKSAFLKLAASGVHLHIYSTKAPLYIHAKMIITDNNEAFIGSQNFSATSLTTNRELGIFITQPAIINSLERIFAKDWIAK